MNLQVLIQKTGYLAHLRVRKQIRFAELPGPMKQNIINSTNRFSNRLSFDNVKVVSG